MKLVVTGSSGRVGRAIVRALAGDHDVVGLDRKPFPTTRVTADICDPGALEATMAGADAVIHAAALHAPHVGRVSDTEFWRINVDATRTLAECARRLHIPRVVFTSTTALYGNVVEATRCVWIDEATAPQPRTIYHRTKHEAERALAELAGPRLAVRILRVGRCFPEPVNRTAVYRLHRGVDVRDVAVAHAAALVNPGPAFQCHVVSGRVAFQPDDCEALACGADAVIRNRCPELADAFDRRGWPLPTCIDRVYASRSAATDLAWHPRHGFAEVLAQFDRQCPEVLPPDWP